MPSISESVVEEAALNWFRALGYTLLAGTDTAKRRRLSGRFRVCRLAPSGPSRWPTSTWFGRRRSATLQRGGPAAAARHPDLIPQTRALLAPHPFTIIENVPRAPIRADVVLTGPMVLLSASPRWASG